MRAEDFALSVGDMHGASHERAVGGVLRARGAAAGHGRRSAHRREMRAWMLPALERLAAYAAAPEGDRDEIVARAGVEAVALRDRVEGIMRFDEELACRLHDTALQLLEYVATDGFGQELEREQLAELLGRTAAEVRAALEGRRADIEDLDRALGVVAQEARALGLPEVELSCPAGRTLRIDQLEAIVDAVREALTNVRKHARAERVTVSVEDAAGELRVRVTDDGVGADPAALAGASGIGLVSSIRGRLGRHGGRALVQTAPGAGTTVIMAMPVRDVS
jgi:signal transduction histidine kinase